MASRGIQKTLRLDGRMADDIARQAKEEELDEADVMRRWLRKGRDVEAAEKAKRERPPRQAC